MLPKMYMFGALSLCYTLMWCVLCTLFNCMHRMCVVHMEIDDSVQNCYRILTVAFMLSRWHQLA